MEDYQLSNQMLKAFTHHSQARISSSFHDHSAHDNLANSHSTVQRQILQMICSEVLDSWIMVQGNSERLNKSWKAPQPWTSLGLLKK